MVTTADIPRLRNLSRDLLIGADRLSRLPARQFVGLAEEPAYLQFRRKLDKVFTHIRVPRHTRLAGQLAEVVGRRAVVESELAKWSAEFVRWVDAQPNVAHDTPKPHAQWRDWAAKCPRWLFEPTSSLVELLRFVSELHCVDEEAPHFYQTPLRS